MNQGSDFFKFGHEEFCNLKGQYVTIVADMSRYEDKTQSVSVCSVGIFGTSYERSEPMEASYSYDLDLEEPIIQFTIQNLITADLMIGFSFKPIMRQKNGDELNFVTLASSADYTSTIVTIDTELLPVSRRQRRLATTTNTSSLFTVSLVLETVD